MPSPSRTDICCMHAVFACALDSAWMHACRCCTVCWQQGLHGCVFHCKKGCCLMQPTSESLCTAPTWSLCCSRGCYALNIKQKHPSTRQPKQPQTRHRGRHSLHNHRYAVITSTCMLYMPCHALLMHCFKLMQPNLSEQKMALIRITHALLSQCSLTHTCDAIPSLDLRNARPTEA